MLREPIMEVGGDSSSEFKKEIINLEEDGLGVKNYLLSINDSELDKVDLLLNEINKTV